MLREEIGKLELAPLIIDLEFGLRWGAGFPKGLEEGVFKVFDSEFPLHYNFRHEQLGRRHRHAGAAAR